MELLFFDPEFRTGNGFVLITKRIKNCLLENQMLLNEQETEETETTEIEETSFTEITPALSQGCPN